MEIQDQLRVENRKMANAVPLMAQAADQIDALKAEIKPLQARIVELEAAIQQARGVLETTLRLTSK
jgi:prefoldin subunit 5